MTERPDSEHARGPAPWATAAKRRLLIYVGLETALAVLAIGIALQVTHHGGLSAIIVASILLGFWSIMIPVARRHGKI